MSGPKLSEAELERLKKEQMERQRQEALRLLQEAQGAYRKICRRLQALKEYALESLFGLDPVSRIDAGNRLAQVTGALKEEPVQNVQQPQSYYEAEERMKVRLQEAEGEIQAILGQFADRAAAAQQLVQTGRVRRDFQMFAAKKEALIDVIQMDFRCRYDQQRLKIQIQDFRKHLAKAGQKTGCRELLHFVRRAETGLQVLETELDRGRDTGQVQDALQGLVNEEEELLRRWREEQALYDTYLALACLTGTDPKALSDFPAGKDLKEETERLKEQYRKQDEMDYIADQINDVMVELGYTFVSSRVLARKDKGEMDHSLYQADGRTGISVFTDRSGAVMMRMTVLGDDPVVTEADRNFSYERQIDFCAAHPEIVEALVLRGVFLKQKSYLEPDRKYTYKMSADTQKGAGTANTAADKTLRPQKIDRRKRRRAGGKKMRAL